MVDNSKTEDARRSNQRMPFNEFLLAAPDFTGVDLSRDRSSMRAVEMMTALPGKLVRDRIPEILAAEETQFTVRTLEDVELATALNEKLVEEFTEYRQSGEIEELADIVEVIQAISRQRGLNWDEFERLRAEKRERRGGFTKRLVVSTGCDEPLAP